MKNENLKGELTIMDTLDVKPNYAALGRKYDMDWRTVKKYHEGYEGKPKTRKKLSRLDGYKDEIIDKLSIKRVTVRGVYEFMVKKYGLETIGSYSNFIAYVKKHKLKPSSKTTGHPRVETLPGAQAQVDWKESISLVSKYGETFLINIFHILLSFSRYSYLELSIQKRIEDVYRGLINGFEVFGGVPKEIVFDNMSTVANTQVKPKKVTDSMVKLAKDYGFKVHLCKARAPQTKGSVEAKNKVLDWIRVYDGEFEDLEELVQIVKSINQQMNLTVNEELGMSPVALFYKEKEHLQPLPPNTIKDDYLCPNRYRVANDALIRYGSSKYSVDPKLINEEVTVDLLGNKLYIYYNGKLVTYHPLSEQKLSYKEEHYKILMAGKVKESDMSERINENLKVMDSLLELHRVNVTAMEATKSVEALISYINQNDCGTWVINYYAHLSQADQMTFVKGMNQVLPYIQNQDGFIERIKFSMKNDLCKRIDFDCCINDLMAFTDGECVLTKEGYQLLRKKYAVEIEAFIEEMKEEQCKNNTVDSDRNSQESKSFEEQIERM